MSPVSPINEFKVIDRYYPSTREKPELLRNATVLQSDYRSVRAIVTIWKTIMNVGVANFRPVLSLFSLFSKSHRAYKNELMQIAKIKDLTKKNIEKNTTVYGGEGEGDYAQVEKDYKKWKKKNTCKDLLPTQIFWHDESDSLDAARSFKRVKENARIAITTFANAVRVGGADSVGGKGSQEEHLLRATYLRISLEEAERRTDKKIRSATGRYLQYYSTIVSKRVPTFNEYREYNERFGFVSVAAPDLRTGIRSEGNYFKRQNDPTLIKEVLYRKLSLVMMSAAMEDFDVLSLGAFGCGAFKNNPETVAEVIKDLLEEERFQKVFTHIILPIGVEDPNRKPFEDYLKYFNKI